MPSWISFVSTINLGVVCYLNCFIKSGSHFFYFRSRFLLSRTDLAHYSQFTHKAFLLWLQLLLPKSLLYVWKKVGVEWGCGLEQAPFNEADNSDISNKFGLFEEPANEHTHVSIINVLK